MLNGVVTLTGNAQVDIAATGSLDLTSAIGDGGNNYGFTKAGSGTLILGASSTYTGITTVSDGILEVDGDISTSSEVDVSAGAALGGSGTVGNVVVTGGTLVPADGPNTLTAGAVSLDANSTCTVQIDGNSPGNGATGYDQIVAGGTVSLGNATLSVSIGVDYFPEFNDQLTIIKNNSGSAVTGTFNGLPEGAVIVLGSDAFRISYQGGANQDDVVLTYLTATTTQVSTAPQTLTYGQSVTFTAQVSSDAGAPAGSVAFYEGDPASGGIFLGSGTVDFQGKATFSTTALHVTGSPHQIYAAFTSSPSSPCQPIATPTAFAQTVVPAPLTIKANDVNKAYGDPLPQTFTFSYTGFQNGDTAAGFSSQPTATTAATQSSHVNLNGYAITPTGAVHPDYTLAYVDGTLTVTPVGLTVAANNTSKSYGAPIPTLTASFSGFVNGDTAASLTHQPVLSTTANQSSPVIIGGYPITGSGADEPDYSFRYVPGTLTIIPATVTVSADDQSMSYGGPVPSLAGTYTITGLVNGDNSSVISGTPALATTAASSSPAGDYAITVDVSGLSAANYGFTGQGGILTINLATLDVSAGNQSMTYGGAVPSLTFTASGLVNGNTAGSVLSGSLATSGSSSSHAGIYLISQGTLTATSNYVIAFAAGSLTISPAPLSITANDASAIFGAPFPTLSASYSGFVNGDTAVSLTTAAILTTTATTSSPAAQYPIQVAGAASPDYAITFHPGTLSIAQASSSINFITPGGTSVTGQSVSFTVQVNPISPGTAKPQGVVNFFVDGSPFGSAPVDPLTGHATFSTAAIGQGTHAITAAYAGSPNFLASQAGSVQQAVGPASTVSIVTACAVRNRRGQIVSVILTTQVHVANPGSGMPTGTVTYFVNRHSSATVTLHNATTVLTFTAKKVVNKSVFVTYNADNSFRGSTSPKLVITKKSLNAAPRPALAFLTRIRARTSKIAGR
jgi:autotransporter-associated beta strand protein